MEIDGLTRVIPHLACPSAHVRTPQLFNARCRELGINAVVVPWEVQPDALAATMVALRSAASVPGCIVTIPHKESVTAFCQRCEGVAGELGVANVVRREADGTLTASMHDGVGFVAGLKRQGHDPAGRRVLLLGAGGAATAIAQALLDAGAGELAIANRSSGRVERLVARLRVLDPAAHVRVAAADGRGFDIIVNATSVGLAGDPATPLDPATIDPGCCVAEVIMNPAETPLLRAAAARGALGHRGEHMLTAQIDSFIARLLPAEAAAAGLQTA